MAQKNGIESFSYLEVAWKTEQGLALELIHTLNYIQIWTALDSHTYKILCNVELTETLKSCHRNVDTTQFVLRDCKAPHEVPRSSRQEMFCKKGVHKNFAKLTGKHLCQTLFFNKVAGLKPTTLLKKRLWHRCFPVNFAKSLRTFFDRTAPVAASEYQ